MIVVHNSEEGQDGGSPSNRLKQQVRHGYGPTGNQTANSGPNVAIGDASKLSRERMHMGPSHHLPDARRFRNESEDERDDAHVAFLNETHARSYSFARRPTAGAAIQPSVPAVRTSHRYSRNVSNELYVQHNGDQGRPYLVNHPVNHRHHWNSQRPVLTHAHVAQNRPFYAREQLNHYDVNREQNGYHMNRSDWASFQSSNAPIARKEPSLPMAAVRGMVLANSPLCQGDVDIQIKRSHSDESPLSNHPIKKAKARDMLDMLCQATLDVGPLQDNPTGCSCPKSKCVALYCDCFKAGRRCNPDNCGCLDCKNTVAESGINGARSKAIRSILARNPRAFLTAGISAADKKPPPGEMACNCVRSKCLKLYCTCFQGGKVCTKSCTCVDCANTEKDGTGERQLAIQLCLEKRPDAFEMRVREPGIGCACKNNRCIRKYCECFRTELACTDKCSCRHCENQASDENKAIKK
jgi:hypothetical protein